MDLECFSSWAACCWLPMASSPWVLAASITQSHEAPTAPSLLSAGVLAFVPNSSAAAEAGWQINCCVEACQSEPWVSPQARWLLHSRLPASTGERQSRTLKGVSRLHASKASVK